MKDEHLILIGTMTVLAVVAFFFIRRALRNRQLYRQKEENLLVKGAITSTRDGDSQQSDKDKYLLRFIYLVRSPFKGKCLRIRPQYHGWIRKIIHVIGEDETTIGDYVDRVLKAHFDDNREIINELYNDRIDGLFNDDHGDE